MKAHRGLQGKNATPPYPPYPTKAIPGTEAKIRVMEERVADGYQPHHPHDYMEEKRPT